MTLTSLLRPFVILPILLLTASFAATAATTLDPASATSAQFFGLDKVYTIHLTLSAAEYKALEPAGPSMARPGVSGDDRYPTSTAILEFEGKPWGPINLRYKGNSSYRSAGALKRPIKLEFQGDATGKADGKDKTRTFFGMTKINLNNNAMDASQMREALGYDIFRQEGVPAARTAFAKVYLTVPGTYDNQYAGLYTIVEQIDQTFFKDRFGRKTGPVVKPEGLNGMPYLGDDWDKYLVPYGAKSTDKIDPEDAKRFIAFVRFVKEATDEEFAKRIGEFVDVDEFMHFLAVEVMTVNLDSPLGFNHNYYITINPRTQKITWIPWDLNLAFGGFGGGGRGGGGGSAQQDLSVNKPTAKGQFPLADRILAVPELLKQYDTIFRNLATKNFTVERVSSQMDLMANAIRASVKTDIAVSPTQFERNMATDPSTVTTTDPAPATTAGGFVVIDPLGRPGGGFGGFGGGRGGRGPGGMGGPPLRQFVALRVESVLAQLDGKRDGFTAPGRGGGRGGFGGGPRGFGN